MARIHRNCAIRQPNIRVERGVGCSQLACTAVWRWFVQVFIEPTNSRMVAAEPMLADVSWGSLRNTTALLAFFSRSTHPARNRRTWCGIRSTMQGLTRRSRFNVIDKARRGDLRKNCRAKASRLGASSRTDHQELPACAPNARCNRSSRRPTALSRSGRGTACGHAHPAP